MQKFTVITTASFIPSHPSIKVIRETIESFNLISEYQDFNIVLAHDFFDNDLYVQYLDNLQNYISNNDRISIQLRKTHGHLIGNINNVLDLVDTKYLLVVQHDLPFIRKFEIQKIIEDMEQSSQIKHLRFNQRPNLKMGWDADSDIFGEQLRCKNYTYTKTPAWSDQNHICLKSYYTDMVIKEAKKGFMETSLRRGPSTENGHKKYGTYLFGEYGALPTIKNIDGRKFKQ